MSEQPVFKHGFVLNVSQGGGEASIFVHRFFPDQIVSPCPSPDGGTDVTVKCADGSDMTVPVVQSPEAIRNLIAECKRLDQVSEAES